MVDLDARVTAIEQHLQTEAFNSECEHPEIRIGSDCRVHCSDCGALVPPESSESDEDDVCEHEHIELDLDTWVCSQCGEKVYP